MSENSSLLFLFPVVFVVLDKLGQEPIRLLVGGGGKGQTFLFEYF